MKQLETDKTTDLPKVDNRANETVWKYLQLSREMPMRYYLLKYPSMLPDENYLFLKILYDIAGGDSIGLKIEREDTERFRLTMGNHSIVKMASGTSYTMDLEGKNFIAGTARGLSSTTAEEGGSTGTADEVFELTVPEAG